MEVSACGIREERVFVDVVYAGVTALDAAVADGGVAIHVRLEGASPEDTARDDREASRSIKSVSHPTALVPSILTALSTWLVVASDHGGEAATGSEKDGFNERPGAHTGAAKGVLFIRGPHVQRGLVLEHGNPQDLMPTMAWLLGLPIAD